MRRIRCRMTLEDGIFSGDSCDLGALIAAKRDVTFSAWRALPEGIGISSRDWIAWQIHADGISELRDRHLLAG